MKITISSSRRLIFSILFMLGCTAAWAQSEITIVRGDEDYPPFEMMADGKLTGLHTDMVNAVAVKIGVKINWQSVPWKRALQMVESGYADGITYIGKTPEREVWAIFSEENLLSSSKINFIVLKENASKITFDGNLAKFLENHTPILCRGFSFGDQIDKGKKFEADNMEQMIEMLKAKRSDIALVNWGDFVGAFKGKPAMKEIVPLSPPAIENKNYIAFSKAKKDEALAKRFGDAMKAYKKTSAYPVLLKHYGLGAMLE